MKQIKALSTIDESEYSLTEAELEEARKHIKCYDVILSEEEVRRHDEIIKKHHKENLEYEKKHGIQ